MIKVFDLSKLGLTGTATNFNSSGIAEGMTTDNTDLEVKGGGKKKS